MYGTAMRVAFTEMQHACLVWLWVKVCFKKMQLLLGLNQFRALETLIISILTTQETL